MKVNKISCPSMEELLHPSLIANQQRRRDVTRHGNNCSYCQLKLAEVAEEEAKYL
ncbi:MAG: hypothetical protein AAB903_03165 [Patescibacteria group bacterium]